MSDQKTKAQTFRALHVKGQPLVLFNVWDAGSAKAVAEAGAKAIASGSWSVAAANGFADGEAVPLNFALENASRIVGACALPVTLDFERGYGDSVDDLAQSARRLLATGVIGCNLEDGLPGTANLREVSEQAKRIARLRREAEGAGVPFFINARSDGFLNTPAAGHDQALLRQAMERGKAFADAGADGLFLPGLVDPALIERAVRESPLPINIMASASAPPLASLAALGVARVSHGPGPYRAAMKFLAEATKAAFGP